MLFNSHVFIFLFLPLALLGTAAAAPLHARAPILWLIVASLLFYGYWNPVYVVPLLVLMTLNYGFGRWIASTGSRWVLAAGIAINLLILGYFKYTNFFLSTVSALGGGPFETVAIVLPLGISFFMFQKIAYLVDTYRGKVTKHGFLEYSLFVTFFPQLIAGPIVHQQDVLPQFTRRPIRITARNLAIGSTIFAIGLLKKVAIADRISRYGTPVFDAAAAGATVTFVEAWCGTLAYTFQIYFDFSGYSDMAIGLGRMFGIRLPINFNSPYKALSISEFWRRWHMTLSRFLRDYLYVPLGGNRKGPLRRYANLMTVMLLGGLWHGASWNFVVWGGLHGIYLVINHAWSGATRRLGVQSFGRLGQAMCWLVTFLAVVVAWVFFRAANLEAATAMLAGMAGMNGFAVHAGLFGGPAELAALGALLLVCVLLPNTQQIMRRYSPALGPIEPGRGLGHGLWRLSPGWATLSALTLAASVLLLTGHSEFLYFQF